MKTKIFYFSGTGNSLAFARKLANELGNAQLVSIPDAMEKNDFDIKASKIGFVFPVYGWGPPRMVEEFIKELNVPHDTYIFAVATCGGTPGGTLELLEKMLRKRGAKLDIGFVTKERSYPLMGENSVIKLMKSLSDQEQFVSGDERLKEIARLISRSETRKPEMNSFISRALGNTIHKGAMKAFKKSDSGFNTDENCTGCKTCQNICPRGNISFSKGKPQWNNDCEQCMACIQWCPNQAIQIKDVTIGLSRGHNPEVVLADMM